MANQQLLDYINQQIKAGISPEDIKKALAAAGWPAKYIDEGFFELSHIATPPAATPPINSPIAQQINDTKPEKPQILQSSNLSISEPKPKSRRGLGLVFLTLGLILTLGGAVAYGYLYKIGPFSSASPYTENNLFSGLLASASLIDSSSYEFRSSLAINQRDADAVPWTSSVGSPSQEFISQFKRDHERSVAITDILGELNYKKAPYPQTLQTISEAGRSIYYDIDITDPKSKQPYNYKVTENGNNFLLTASFETDNAILALKKSYKYSSTSTPISNKEVTFTKNSGTYFYIPATPPKPFLMQLEESFEYLPPSTSGDFSISATSGRDKQNTDWKFNISANGDFGDLTYKVNLDALRKNKSYYFRINNFPDIFLSFIPSFASLKGSWIKVGEESSSTVPTYDPISMFANEIPRVEESYKKNKQEFVDVLKKAAEIADSEKLISFKNPPRSEQVDGRNLHRYDLKINKAAILPFYRKLIDENKKINNSWPILDDGYIAYLESPEFNEIFDFYEKNTSLTLWVDSKGFPAILSYDMRVTPPDSATQLKDKQINVVLKLILTNINEPIDIEEPKDAKLLNEINLNLNKNNEGAEELLKQARDSTRALDLASLDSTLALYLSTEAKPILCKDGQIYKSTNGSNAVNGSGWIPVNFSAIVGGSPLASLPVDPINNKEYYYSYACDTKTITYEMNAKFESSKYNTNLKLPSKDGGDLSDIYEVGTNLGLKIAVLRSDIRKIDNSVNASGTINNSGLQTTSGKDARRIADLSMIQNSLALFFNACNKYPSEKGGLNSILNPSLDENCKSGPKTIGVNQIPKDPNGSSYFYCLIASGNRYTLATQLENLESTTLDNQSSSKFPCAPKDTSGILRACHNEIDTTKILSGVYCRTI